MRVRARLEIYQMILSRENYIYIINNFIYSLTNTNKAATIFN